MEFRFDNLFYRWDSDEILHMCFDSSKTEHLLYLNGANVSFDSELKKKIALQEWNKCETLDVAREDRIVVEIRQNEMLQTYFLLKNGIIIKSHDRGENTEKGFVYIFDIYEPSDIFYQKYILEEYNDSEVLNINLI